MKVYLSPSDQTTNVGVGNFGTEAARMQDLSNMVKSKLTSAGHTVYGSTNSISLSDRVAASNNAKVDVHVALHSNAGGGTGPETWYYTNSANGKRLAQAIQTKLEALKGSGRGIKYSTSYYELNNTNAPAVIVEVAFHDNQSDVNWMMANWNNIAQAIADGIKNY